MSEILTFGRFFRNYTSTIVFSVRIHYSRDVKVTMIGNLCIFTLSDININIVEDNIVFKHLYMFQGSKFIHLLHRLWQDVLVCILHLWFEFVLWNKFLMIDFDAKSRSCHGEVSFWTLRTHLLTLSHHKIFFRTTHTRFFVSFYKLIYNLLYQNKNF